MSYLSAIKSLYKNLRDGLRLAHLACKIAARVNAEIQASNADAGLKTLVGNWLTSTNACCDAIKAFDDSLPGN